MANMNMIQALNSAMDIMLERDPSVVLLGEDIGYFGPMPARVRRLQRLKKAKLTTDASDNTDKGKAIK